MNHIRPAVPSGTPARSAYDHPTSDVSPSSDPSLPARTHVSVACDQCKQRRRKCSGNYPCESCTRMGIPCVFTAGDDGRRRAARKRKVQDIQGDADLLNELLEALQETKDGDLADVLSVIRSNAPMEDVKTAVRQQITDTRLAKLSPGMQHLDNRMDGLQQSGIDDRAPKAQDLPVQRKTLDVAHLTDEPPYNLPASPWTSVTDDDLLVSHLISSWLRWQRPFYNWIDEDLFIRDMRLGSLNCTYCSPFMVNAMLAVACACSEYDEIRTKHGATSDLMLTFLDEAQRLLDGYASRPSITTPQGLALLYLAFAHSGQDSVGFQYLKQAVSVCKGLQIKFAGVRATQIATQEERLFSRALDTTMWGIFNITTMTSLLYQRPSEMTPPSRPIPEPSEDSHDWTPYPMPGPSKPCYSGELLHHYTSFGILVRDVGWLLYGQDEPEPERGRRDLEDAVLKMHIRLSQWYRSLPNHLNLQAESPPSVLTHITYYHCVIISMLQSLQQHSKDASATIVAQAKEASKTAALEIVKIVRIHQGNYGWNHMAMFLFQPITLALYALLEGDKNSYDAEILDLCVFFRAMSRRWPIALAALRMFQVTARKVGTRLPPATAQLFEEFENQDWQESEPRRLISSLPIGGGGENIDPEMQNMSDFFEMMEILDVGS